MAQTTTEQVRRIADFAERWANPGVTAAATFDALLLLAGAIDELKAEAKK